MKKSVFSILFSVLTFFATSASADPVVPDPGDFADIGTLTHKVCGMSPSDATATWEIAKPPLFGFPAFPGDPRFANPAKDCKKVCTTWVRGCDKSAFGFGKCNTATATTAGDQLKAECKTIQDSATRKFCLQNVGMELNTFLDDIRDEVKAAKAACKDKADLQMCIDDCVAAVTVP